MPQFIPSLWFAAISAREIVEVNLDIAGKRYRPRIVGYFDSKHCKPCIEGSQPNLPGQVLSESRADLRFAISHQDRHAPLF